MHRISLNWLIALAFLNPLTGFAETNSTADEIVVTASRAAQTADDALASVTVVTREDIESSQAESLVELLQHYAGIDILRSGGGGQQTSLFMRGTSSDHTLVLVDGLPVSSATTGAYQWENLSLNSIEKIEIVRGPRSALYGSEAIGGVIQVFTRDNKNIETGLLGGSFATYGANISGSIGDAARLRFDASRKQADGYSATNINSFSYDADDDGYNHQSVGIGLATELGDRTSLDIYAKQSDLNNEYDAGTSNTHQQLVNARVDITPSASTAYKVSAGMLLDELDSVGAFSSSRVTTRRNSLTLQSSRQLAANKLLTIGIDYRQDQGTNIDTMTPATVFDNRIDNTGGYFSLSKPLAAGSLELAGRVDAHSQFGNHPTGQLAWGRKLAANRSLYLSLGTGFKAPDLNELFHPGFDYSAFIPGCNPCYAGNPSLQPEESTSFELGIKQKHNNSRRSFALFYNRVRNLIASEGTNYQAINIGRALTYGLEFGQTAHPGHWEIDTQLTLQRAIDESTGNALLRRPNEKLSIRATRRLGDKSSAMVEARGSLGHEDYGVTLPGYAVANLVYIRKLNADWRLSARINNLFDRKYEVISGYNTTPRSFLLSLGYRPGS